MVKVRIGRLHFWLLVGTLTLIQAALAYFDHQTSFLLVPWLMTYGWRLHDIGRSAWWAVLPAGLVVIATIVLAQIVQETALGWMITIGGIAQIALTVWLGCIPSQPGKNRYGWTYPKKEPLRPTEFA